MNKSQARILYVGNHAGHFLTHRLPIFQGLQKAGYEVHVAVPAHVDRLEQLMTQDAESAITNLGFFYHKIILNRSSIRPLHEVRTLRSLYNLYQEVKPDLVFHATIKPIILGGIVSRVTNIPGVINLISGLGYIFLATGYKGLIFRHLAKAAYRIALARPQTHTIFQNHDDYAVFITNRIIAPQNASIVKGSGVDMDKFYYTPEPVGDPIVVLSSRMLWDKGVQEFVDAATQLKKEGCTAHFLLVGDSDPDNPRAIPSDQLQAWHDSGFVEWRGWVHDIVTVLQNSHIVCLPTFYREGIPKALIEAAACGRPIVTTDSPGCREIVSNEENGLLIPIRDTEAVATALKRLINDRELRQAMGKQGRKRAEEAFSAEVIAANVVHICDELLNIVSSASSSQQQEIIE